jgi:hypothetical protein
MQCSENIDRKRAFDCDIYTFFSLKKQKNSFLGHTIRISVGKAEVDDNTQNNGTTKTSQEEHIVLNSNASNVLHSV